ncbi:MAG: 4a-hydroxytetrahydrobiopterin dehydratase [Sphingobium sp.]
MITPLSIEERSHAIAGLDNWSYDDERKALFRHIEFKNFSEAIGFMVRVAIIAEVADHHPEWANVYNRLDIWLTTHDAGGVSARDLILAKQIDDILISRA